jgi:hypothetical protein
LLFASSQLSGAFFVGSLSAGIGKASGEAPTYFHFSAPSVIG